MTFMTSFLKDTTPASTATGIDRALDAVRKHLGMPYAYLSAFEGDDVVFQAVSTNEATPIMKPGDRRAAAGTYCDGVRDGSLQQLIPDTGACPVASLLSVTHSAPIGAAISVPIKRQDGEIYGMFCCISPDARPNMNARDLDVMTMFASLASDIVNLNTTIDEEDTLIKQRIEDAILDRNFSVHLQPIVDLVSGRIIGAEALSRFRSSPYRSPDKWFADAERVGLAKQLECATLAKAITLLEHMPSRHFISLNVSAELLVDPTLFALVNIRDAHRITLELTEHTQVQDFEKLRLAIAKLRGIGVRIAIDDLGAGYAQLATLLQLKPDLLKMDKSLVRGIHLDPASQALTKALVFFAGQIGAKLLAEGVEHLEECEQLQKLDVELAQGFLFGKPASAKRYAMRN